MRGSPDTAAPSGQPVLSVRDLEVRFGTKRGVAHVVNGITYHLSAGETLAIVGESGSGKSVSALALMGLLAQPPARVEGEVDLLGRSLLDSSEQQWRRVRGNDVAMVFQDPMTALNPVLTVGQQLTEGMRAHLDLGEQAARQRAVALLEQVGIPDPEARLESYPHQLSGGMRQRVMLAIGLSCDPAVLIADEPTTALDVTIQAQILELVGDLQQRRDTAVMWITHDLGVVAGLADRVAVMYAGRIIEDGPVDEVYAAPAHPYTRALLGAVPVFEAARGATLETIPGLPPDPHDLPPGCAFAPRCPYVLDARCRTEVPPLVEVSAGHRAAVLYDPDRAEGAR